MTVSMTKGANVNLTKNAGAGGLPKVVIGLGWDVRTTTGDDFDLDASAIVCAANGKVRTDADYVFFNNLTTPDRTVVHQGDNRTGVGVGDDEQISVDLGGMSQDVDKIVFPVGIYLASERNQNFGQVRNAFIRVVNADSGEELARYDLSEDAATETAMVFGELYRNNGDWKFRALGQGYSTGAVGIAQEYGVNA
jgi:tellurium resistance protein TerD